VCRYFVAAECVAAIRRCAPDALFVLDTVDLHFLREGRGAEITGDPGEQRRAAVIREGELAMTRSADITLVVSDTERDMLRELLPAADVRVISVVMTPGSVGPGFAQRRDMLFVGGFRHRPNVDAVEWYAKEIWPEVRRRLPDARTFVIGSDMPASVRNLAGNGIEAVGHVPDLEPYLRRCRLSIAPLRYGAGVKGKISTAQSAGLPVVATTIAVEGMHLAPGRDVLVADSARAFADAIVRLHEDEPLWHRLVSGGLENVTRYFSADVARPALDGLIDAATARRRGRAAPSH
jgi:glycosyltransferase involved in cell wall biosynthesis